MIRFKATVPSDMVDAAAVVGSSPALVLLCDSQHKQCVADPDSKCFVAYEDERAYPLIRLAVVGGMYADGEKRPVLPLPAAAADKILDLMRQFSVDPSQMFTEDVTEYVAADDAPEIGNRCFLVQSAGQVLVIVKLQQQRRMKVFRMDAGGAVLEPVKGIGSRAIFIGYRRSRAWSKFVYFLSDSDLASPMGLWQPTAVNQLECLVLLHFKRHK
uniref:Uncharacterized protein n=1 Tax=Avena sativa TaxID=4498 RepID=A0ACD6A045_AVESA